MTDDKKINRILDKLIPIGINIARKNEGALFVISDDCSYERLLPQKFESFSIFDVGADKLMEKLAMVDGGVIISKKGLVKDYAVKIKSNKVWMGKGLRHSGAISASYTQDTTVLLVSQEEKKLKIIKQGKVIMQIDALEKDVQTNYKEAMVLLESLGFASIPSLATIIAASLVGIPFVGIVLTPGIAVGASYYLLRRLRN